MQALIVVFYFYDSVFANLLNLPWDTPNARKWADTVLKRRMEMWEDVMKGSVPADQTSEIINLVKTARINAVRIEALDEDPEAGRAMMARIDLQEEEYSMLNILQSSLERRLQMLEVPALR